MKFRHTSKIHLFSTKLNGELINNEHKQKGGKTYRPRSFSVILVMFASVCVLTFPAWVYGEWKLVGIRGNEVAEGKGTRNKIQNLRISIQTWFGSILQSNCAFHVVLYFQRTTCKSTDECLQLGSEHSLFQFHWLSVPACEDMYGAAQLYLIISRENDLKFIPGVPSLQISARHTLSSKERVIKYDQTTIEPLPRFTIP